MATMQERGEAFLRARRRASLSFTVDYQRGGTSVVEGGVLACQAETLDESEVEGYILTSRYIDWLIDKSEFVDEDGDPIPNFEPLPGDVILATLPGGQVRMEVAGTSNEPHARWHSRDNLTWRVHTRHTYLETVTP